MAEPLPPQEIAPPGRLVLGMIERTLRARFHHIEATLPAAAIPRQAIFVANHHGWHDGYVMLALARHLRRPVLDWIAEFDLFPPFAFVGGMPFPSDDPAARATTIRRTIRAMKSESRSLILFPEGVLHRGPDVLPFGRSVETIARAIPEAGVVPVSIRYDLVFHERPVARLVVGDSLPKGDGLAERARFAVALGLASEARGETIFSGTSDVSERARLPRVLGDRAKTWLERRYRRL